MSATTIPKSGFTVSSLLNSNNVSTSSSTTPTNNNSNSNSSILNNNNHNTNNTSLAANVTANYFNFLNKFRPIGFPTGLPTSRALLGPPPPMPQPTPSIIPETASRQVDDGIHDDPKAELESKDLWDQFHQHGTEMVRDFWFLNKEFFKIFNVDSMFFFRAFR